jgi:hypothetical protein
MRRLSRHRLERPGPVPAIAGRSPSYLARRWPLQQTLQALAARSESCANLTRRLAGYRRLEGVTLTRVGFRRSLSGIRRHRAIRDQGSGIRDPKSRGA